MSDKKNKPEWKSYEELIYKIYKELEPIADIRLDDAIPGVESNTNRQIDISIRTQIATHQILMIVQAKHYKKRADVNIVGEFASVIRDVQASKGILICNAGFTRKAKEYAARLKIDLLSAHDASNKNWQTEIQIPVIKKSLRVDLKIQHSYAVRAEMSIDHIELPFPEDAVNIFMNKWYNDELSKESGTHFLNMERDAIQFSEDLLPLKNRIEYTVHARHHFKFFVPNDYRGLKDYLTEKFSPTFMSFSEQIPFLNDGTWKYIESPAEVSLNTLHLNIEALDVNFLKKKMLRFVWED